MKIHLPYKSIVLGVMCIAFTTAGYGQASNIDYVANNAPGVSDDSINLLTSGTLQAWSTTYQSNGQYAGGFKTTGNNNTGGNSPAGGWDIYAGPGAYVDMYHGFDGKLTAGQTLSLTLAGGGVMNESGTQGVIGINLVQGGGSFSALFSLYFKGGDGNWQYTNGDVWPGNGGTYNSGSPASGSYITAGYNYNSTNTFTLTMLDGLGNYSATYGISTWTGTLAGGADNVDAIRIFNNSGGASSDIVINSLQVTTVPEPCSTALIIGGLGLLAVVRRRRA